MHDGRSLADVPDWKPIVVAMGAMVVLAGAGMLYVLRLL